MIFEGHPWKQELGRLLSSLSKWSSKPESSRAEFYIQRAVFISAFVMRKLMENRKLTDAVRDRSIRCNAFRPLRPISGRISTFAGLANVTDDYDMQKPEQITMSSFDLMSEIMHSYVFKIVLDDQDQMVSFLVNSYNKRDDRLLEIDRKSFEKILTDAIGDRVESMTFGAHPISGKIIAVVQGSKGKKA
jgi:hypothetical protein